MRKIAIDYRVPDENPDAEITELGNLLVKALADHGKVMNGFALIAALTQVLQSTIGHCKDKSFRITNAAAAIHMLINRTPNTDPSDIGQAGVDLLIEELKRKGIDVAVLVDEPGVESPSAGLFRTPTAGQA